MRDYFSFLKRRAGRSRKAKLPASAGALDVDFYRSYYTDLAHMTEEEALQHYVHNGFKEGRHPNFKECIQSLENEARKLPEDFCPREYLAVNTDLGQSIDLSVRNWEATAHYLKYGRWEGRPYKHGGPKAVYDAEILHRMTDHVYAMPEVAIDAARRATVNMLVPAFQFESMSAGFFGVFQVALFIKKCGLHVRLVMYAAFQFDEASFREKLKHYPGLETLFDDLEVEYIGDRKNPLRISSRDNCVATVCHSAYLARKIMAARGGGKFLYLIQDNESSFYPGGSLFAIAEMSYSFDYAALFSTQSLQNHFLRHKTGIFGRGVTDYIYLNNACSSVLKPEGEFLAARQKGNPERLFFYSRPQVNRNMFEIGALALCTAFQEGVFARDEWEFIGAGLGEPVVQLGPGTYLKQMKRMNLREYQEVVSTFDLGFCLMASSHPSLTPFDLHGSGATVVTNSYGVKDQAYFDSVAPGIIVSEPDVPALVDALRRAVSASGDLAARYRNARAMKYPRSWDESFRDEHVDFIRKVFSETFR